MAPFARIVIGNHGCTEAYARELLLGTKPFDQWQPSTNDWDWLGHGIYFWEHSPQRAMRWAQEQHAARGETPAALGAVIQLGRFFDLLNEAITAALAQTYHELIAPYQQAGKLLPQNRGRDWKRRELDCLVIKSLQGERAQTGVWARGLKFSWRLLPIRPSYSSAES